MIFNSGSSMPPYRWLRNMSTFPLPSMAWGVKFQRIKGERMEKMETADIDALIAAVEAGGDQLPLSDIGFPDGTVWRAIPSGTFDGQCLHDLINAYRGSLDAAKRLHDALLPGWAWGLNDDGEAEVWPYVGGFDAPAIVGVCRDNPARAWLLSILRAVKAKGERG
jgi:hypothetical protein